jgi:excisionase family DNA binding protein
MSEKRTDRTPENLADGEGLAVSVPEAGRPLGLGRNSAYEAAAKGDIPTIRIGGRILVPRKALDRLLDTATEAWQRRQAGEVA